MAARSLVELPSQTRTHSPVVWRTCRQVDKKIRNSTSHYVSLQPVSSANQTARGSLARVKLIKWHAALSIIYYTVSPSLRSRLTSTRLRAAGRLTWWRNADLTVESDLGTVTNMRLRCVENVSESQAKCFRPLIFSLSVFFCLDVILLVFLSPLTRTCGWDFLFFSLLSFLSTYWLQHFLR